MKYPEIIPTVRRIDTVKFEDIINFFYEHDIRTIRFNAAKFMNIEDLVIDIKYVNDTYGKSMKVLLDIPYPKCKMRIFTRNPCQILKGGKYNLRTDSIGEKDIFKINQLPNIPIESIVIYSNGEGAFKIINRIEHGYEVEALNSFILDGGKSLSCGAGYEQSSDTMHYIQNNLLPDSILFSFLETSSEIRDLNLPDTIEKVAKIETKKGVQSLDDILAYSDGVMIARGDLCINLSITDYIYAQFLISDKSREYRKKLYVATNIMDSMINNFIPSRSDISDLFFISELLPDALILSLKLSYSENFLRVLDIIKEIWRIKHEC